MCTRNYIIEREGFLEIIRPSKFVDEKVVCRRAVYGGVKFVSAGQVS